MSPQSRKAKGRIFQNFIRDLILEKFPSLGKDDVRSTSMGASGQDIQLSPAARLLVPHQIECKSTATSLIHTYYAQAKTHGDHEPLVIVKKNHDIPLAIVSAEYYFELLRKISEN